MAHESQHAADYKKFKNLDSFALEYRAKLAEIIASNKNTKKLVNLFKAQSSSEKKSYHHYASYKLIKNLNLSSRLTPTQIRNKAIKLLLKDSNERLESKFNSL